MPAYTGLAVIIIIIKYYFHIKKQTIGTVQLTCKIIEMVDCQKSKCSSSWSPSITFTCTVNIQTFIPTFCYDM